jgi:hypothetical protein
VRLEVISLAIDSTVRVGRSEFEAGHFTDLGAQEPEEGVADGKAVVGRAIGHLRVWLALGLFSDAIGDPGGFDRIDEVCEDLVKTSHYSVSFSKL